MLASHDNLGTNINGYLVHISCYEIMASYFSSLPTLCSLFWLIQREGKNDIGERKTRASFEFMEEALDYSTKHEECRDLPRRLKERVNLLSFLWPRRILEARLCLDNIC